MFDYIIPTPIRPSLPVRGTSERFPVRRIYCIGRNYADHAIEMGHDPEKEPPFFFQKNAENIDSSGEFPYPPETNDVHFEVEMIVALKSGGANIEIADAMQLVFGYGVGLDMTRRDLQGEMKKLGRPWEIGKAFERSAPMGPLVSINETGQLDSGVISLSVDGTVRQNGDLNQMIWKVPEQIAYLSRFYDIAAGDLIMSGTPAGVGSIHKGEIMECRVDGLDPFVVKVV
ncbi:fumarylacetoacetate hydrolase family protein [Candidatus Puniceispirillum sp.]|nr:fumarylacetoacetate hydrolase family protein [Candidatus Puniceispirillum sp.]